MMSLPVRLRELSDPQRVALVRMHAAGALHRWPGGFWSDAPPRRLDMVEVPTWSLTVQTLRALERRGLVVVAEREPRYRFAVRYVLTADGTAVVQELSRGL